MSTGMPAREIQIILPTGADIDQLHFPASVQFQFVSLGKLPKERKLRFVTNGTTSTAKSMDHVHLVVHRMIEGYIVACRINVLPSVSNDPSDMSAHSPQESSRYQLWQGCRRL